MVPQTARWVGESRRRYRRDAVYVGDGCLTPRRIDSIRPRQVAALQPHQYPRSNRSVSRAADGVVRRQRRTAARRPWRLRSRLAGAMEKTMNILAFLTNHYHYWGIPH